MRTLQVLVLSLLPFAFTPVSAQEPVSLERTLLRAAPEVLKHCRDAGYKNVGVLKFLSIKHGAGKVSDNAGTLNRTLARQLELGMILANDARNPIGIIDNASDVAAKTVGANHLTREGRPKLFVPKYPLAWGSEQVTPDAFLTGLASISGDLKTFQIELQCFDAKTNRLVPVGKQLVARNDPRKLSEMGESFTRGAFDDGNVELAKGDPQAKEKLENEVLAAAARTKADPAAAPVKLTILYDGKAVPFELKDGKAFVPEPNEGQKVELLLKREPGKATLACVLKVNGRNTLFEESLPDLACRKWILGPEEKKTLRIQGMQLTADTVKTFKVLSNAETKEREISYGADVGTITLTVFRDLVGKPVKEDLKPETLDAKIVEQATLPAEKSPNFDALAKKLRDDANRNPFDGDGEEKQSKITIVKFVPDPTPVMGLTVVYYKR